MTHQLVNKLGQSNTSSGGPVLVLHIREILVFRAYVLVGQLLHNLHDIDRDIGVLVTEETSKQSNSTSLDQFGVVKGRVLGKREKLLQDGVQVRLGVDKSELLAGRTFVYSRTLPDPRGTCHAVQHSLRQSDQTSPTIGEERALSWRSHGVSNVTISQTNTVSPPRLRHPPCRRYPEFAANISTVLTRGMSTYVLFIVETAPKESSLIIAIIIVPLGRFF